MGILWLVLLGLAIGLVLGGLGGGGAILTVPALVYVAGQTAAQATTSSLVIVGAAAVTGVASHVRTRTVSWRTGLFFGAAGIPAAWLGSHLSHAVDGSVLMLGFSALMLAAAVVMLRPQPRIVARRAVAVPAVVGAGAGVPSDEATASAEEALEAPVCLRCSSKALVIGAGLGVGFLTGFLGVGGGFVVVPALVLVIGLPMRLAVGTSLVVVAMNAATALVARSTTAEFDWSIIIPFALTAMVGALVGRRVADRLPADQLRRAFAVLLVLVAGYTIWHSVSDLSQPETAAAASVSTT
jgi:uncharacterized membrane protein YfcA